MEDGKKKQREHRLGSASRYLWVLAGWVLTLSFFALILNGGTGHAFALPLALGLLPLAVMPFLVVLISTRHLRRGDAARLSFITLMPSLAIAAIADGYALRISLSAISSASELFEVVRIGEACRSLYLAVALAIALAFGAKGSHPEKAPRWLFLYALGAFLLLQCLDLTMGLLPSLPLLISAFCVAAMLLTALILFRRGRAESSPFTLSLSVFTALQASSHLLLLAPSAFLGPKTLLLLIKGLDLLGFAFTLPFLLKEDGSGRPALGSLDAGLAAPSPEAGEASGILNRLSHELRTPLHAIVGLSEVLRQDLASIPSAQSEDIEKINQAAWQLLGLVDELLDLSTLPQQSIVLHETYFDAERFASMLDRMGQVLAAPYLTRFTVHCPRGLGTLHGDENRLLQICMNLIRNALRYTRDGRIDLHLYPSWEKGEARIRIDIKDSGKGMKPTELASVFQLLAAAPSPGEEDIAKLNLLIPTTQKLCDLIGARLKIESSAGLGTTSSISFVDRLGEKRTVLRETKVHAKPKALLIESGGRGNEDILDLLSHRGVELNRVRKPSSGLRVFFEMHPDFVLADARNWTLEKVEMLESIRHGDPECPIFVIHEGKQDASETRRIRQEIEKLCEPRRVLRRSS